MKNITVKNLRLHLTIFLFVLFMPGCTGIELRSLSKPQINMSKYNTFTTVNQAKPEELNYLRDEVLLHHVSKNMAKMGYSKVQQSKARARVTLVFNEGFEKVFVPPSSRPIISYSPGEFTTVTGRINGEKISLFGYISPRRIERYIEIPAHKIDVYKLMLRIDIYDSKTLDMVWTGTAYKESSPGKAIKDTKVMIDKLLKKHLPDLQP